MSEPAAVTISKVVHVCHDCRKGLVELGARVVDEPVTITLGWGCEAHPTKTPVQASHALRVLPSALREWLSRVPIGSPIVAGASFVDVARLAARWVTPESQTHDLEASVELAKRLLRIAKGEGGSHDG